MEQRDVAAVWCPAQPLLGAAVASNLAAVPGAPGAVVDFDRDWTETSSVLLDGPAPLAGPPGDVLGSAAKASCGVTVVASRSFSADAARALVDELREGGGAVLSLPAVLDAAAVAAEADTLLLIVERSFPALRRAKLAIDRLPAARHRSLILVIAEGQPSDLTLGDVVDVLGHPMQAHLPPGDKEVAATLERGSLPAATGRGPWARAIRALAADVWDTAPDMARPDRANGRLARVVEALR